MTIFCTRINVWVLFVLVFLGKRANAQNGFTVLWEPEIAISYDVAPFYSHHFSIEKRSSVYEDSIRFNVKQMDFSHFSEYSIMDNQSLALGLLYRELEFFDRETYNEFRLTEQYSLTKVNQSVRWGHRVRAEQRFSNNPTEYRFRYRVALDVPLRGSRLDIGEPYFSSTWENLLSVGQETEPAFAQRFGLEIGFLLSKSTTFETGVQYRLEDYFNRAAHELFLFSGIHLNL